MTTLQLATIAASASLAVVAWKRAEIARAAFVALFVAAGVVNVRVGFVSPAELLVFTRGTTLETLRGLSLGLLAHRATPLLASVAAGQLTIAWLLASRRPASSLGAIAAAAYFLLVGSHGVGSTFAASLLSFFACIVVGRRCGSRSSVAELASTARRWRRRRREERNTLSKA